MFKKRIYINVSDVFTWLNSNPWSCVEKFENFWKKYDTDYNNIMKSSFNKINELKQLNTEKSKEKAKHIEKNIYNISTTCEQKVKDILKTDYEILQKSTFEEQQKTISENKNISQEELQHVNSFINKQNGCKNEINVLKTHENNNNINLDKTQTRFVKQLNVFDTNYDWYIVGRMDGIDYTNNVIVEIKNRARELFYNIRYYENIQLQLYMYLTGLKKCILVEKYKDTSNEIVQTIDSEMIDDILERLGIFCKNFEKFINKTQNEKLDYFILTNNSKQQYLTKYIFT